MKKTFGILFLILGIICLPGCFTGRTEQIIGHLLTATLIPDFVTQKIFIL